jgi:hypothetical protein
MNKIIEYIEKYTKLHKGIPPKFIIMDPSTFSNFSYEINKKHGLDEEESILTDVSEYQGIILAITHNNNFKGFELR